MENPMWKAAYHRGNCVPVQAVQGFHAHQKSTVVAKSAASTVPQFASAYSCFGWCRKKGRNARKARIATICCRLGAEGQRCSAASRKMQRSLCFSARTGRLSVWRQRNTAEKKEEGPGKQQALLAQKKRVFMGEEEERVRTGKNTVSGYVTH